MKVSVIVLNWNGIDLTKKCIASLKKQAFRDFEIIVVDNGSKEDDSVDQLKKVKGIKLVLNKKNLGFAGGNNVGVRASKSEYVALINNDAVVDKNWLGEKLSVLDDNPKIAQVMSKIYNRYENTDYRFDKFGTSTVMQFLADYPEVSPDTKKLVPSFGASGGAQLFRRSVCEVPFDDDYFIYQGDAYFSWYIRLKGFEVVACPTSVVYHEGEATVKKNRSLGKFYVYLGERNRLMNLLIFYSPLSLLRLFPYFAVTTIFLNVYDFKRIPSRLKAYWWIVSHFPKIVKKRRAIQKQRKVSDAEFISYLSCKVFE